MIFIWWQRSQRNFSKFYYLVNFTLHMKWSLPLIICLANASNVAAIKQNYEVGFASRHSMPTMETPEQCLKNLFKVNNKNTKTTLMTCPYCWLWRDFTHFSVVSIDFGQVNVCWVSLNWIKLNIVPKNLSKFW